jgi:hypothetical protein
MGQFNPIDDTISFTSPSQGSSGSVKIQPGVYDAFLVEVDYTVTDVGIEAGENFRGVIDDFYIGEGGNTPIHVKTNEIDILSDILNDGLSTGKWLDADPVTATPTKAYWYLPGPINLTAMKNPIARMAIKAPNTEWGAASAFTATVTISAIASRFQEDPSGVYIERFQASTNTKFGTVETGPGMMKDLFIIMADGDYLSEVTMPAEDKLKPGQASKSDKALNLVSHKASLRSMYATRKMIASVAGRYYIPSVDVDDFVGRDITVKASTTTPILTFSVNRVQVIR